jgi:hypothetical protein
VKFKKIHSKGELQLATSKFTEKTNLKLARIVLAKRYSVTCFGMLWVIHASSKVGRWYVLPWFYKLLMIILL